MPKYDAEKLARLRTLLAQRALTAAQIAAMYHVPVITIRRMVRALERDGVQIKRVPTEPTGKRGKPARAYTVAL